MPSTQQIPKRRTTQLNLSPRETQHLAASVAKMQQDVAFPKNAGHLLQEIAEGSRSLNQRLQAVVEKLQETQNDPTLSNEVSEALELCRAIQMDAMQGSYHHLPSEKESWELAEWTRMLLEQLQTILPPEALRWEITASGPYTTKIPKRLWLSSLQRSVLQAAELQNENGIAILVRLRDQQPRSSRTRVVLEILDRGREISQAEMELRLTDGAGGNPERADGFHLLLLLAKEMEGDLEISSDSVSGTCRRLIMPLKKIGVG